jgi:hypothetical protein
MTNQPPTAPMDPTVAALLGRHAAARRRRNAAPLGSPDYEAACEEIARIEVEIARLGRAANPAQV